MFVSYISMSVESNRSTVFLYVKPTITHSKYTTGPLNNGYFTKQLTVLKALSNLYKQIFAIGD